jgi:hypothetical protein
MQIIITSALIISAISILWRSTLKKKPAMSEKLKKTFPFFLGTAITCGLCFTFWVSFFFVLIFNPIPQTFFSFNNFENLSVVFFSHRFLSWMILGVVALFIRFTYAILEETVDKLNELNGHSHHHHHTHDHK